MHSLHSSCACACCRSSVSDSGTLPISAYGGAFNITTVGAHPEDHGTSHLSVVDADMCDTLFAADCWLWLWFCYRMCVADMQPCSSNLSLPCT